MCKDCKIIIEKIKELEKETADLKIYIQDQANGKNLNCVINNAQKIEPVNDDICTILERIPHRTFKW